MKSADSNPLEQDTSAWPCLHSVFLTTANAVHMLFHAASVLEGTGKRSSGLFSVVL